MRTYGIKSVIGALLLLLPTIPQRAPANADIGIVVLAADNLTSTERSTHGATKVIKRDCPRAAFHHFLVTQSPDADSHIVDSVRALRPNLILTIGSSATRLAKDNFADIPVVFCAVKYPVLSGFVESYSRPDGNVTGASLNIPMEIQFSYFRRIVPELRKVGVLYTNNTAGLIPGAEEVAAREGLTLVPMLVTENKQLPQALDSLAAVVDGLWSVADPNLFTSKATKYILLNALRKSLPFMGFSRNVVESGALFALDFDYKAVGLQAGEIANRILAGARPNTIPVTSADVIWFHYNENTAKRIHLAIPEELVAVAKEVYR